MPIPTSPLSFQCDITPTDQGYAAVGTFHLLLPIDAHLNELDQIECSVEHAGQELKRHLCQKALETADARCSQLFQKAQTHLHKHGKKNSPSLRDSAKSASADNACVTPRPEKQ